MKISDTLFETVIWGISALFLVLCAYLGWLMLQVWGVL